MDDPLRYFSVSGNGLQELVEDCEVWDLVNQCGSPKVVDIWIIKGGVGDDSNEEGCGGSAVNCEQYDGSDDSGEEYDGSEEELTSDAVGIDDEEFDNNIDVNVEYGGLEDIEVQHQETSLAVVPCDEITYSDEGSIAGSDGETRGKKLPKPPNQHKRRRESVTAVQVQQVAHVQQEFHVQLEPQVQEEAQVQHEAQVQEEAQVQQEAQPDVITQPEMEDTQWEIPDDILDAHWHQVVVQSEGIEGGNSLTTTNRIAVQELAQDQHAQSVQQGMASVEATRGIQGPSRGKQVKPPKKSSRNKLPIKRVGEAGEGAGGELTAGAGARDRATEAGGVACGEEPTSAPDSGVGTGTGAYLARNRDYSRIWKIESGSDLPPSSLTTEEGGHGYCFFLRGGRWRKEKGNEGGGWWLRQYFTP
nr:uncharacterized protein LOC109190938 [Ipomoea batatas]